ncbi:hypothetical protein ACQJBY_048641 [Aegilops geniculata]
MFQNYQNGEQSYIHIGCSTHCLSISCDHEYDDSTVSCIHMDRYFQLKYNSRKVRALYLDVSCCSRLPRVFL